MSFATINSRLIKTHAAGLVALFFTIFRGFAQETNIIDHSEAPIVRAERIFHEAQAQLSTNNTPSDLNWHFGQACFDWAEYASNDTQRAEVANLGIAACRALIAIQSNSAPAHYFLGMDLGELAQTKWLGALSIVSEMEREFKTARRLDEKFDFAGPDRNLGLLYHEAPSFGSIGDQGKAKTFLEAAVQIAPDYPENRLNLIEAYLKWSDRVAARRLLDALEAALPDARKQFTGPEWTASWLDWKQRLAKLRLSLGQPPKPIQSSRGKNL